MQALSITAGKQARRLIEKQGLTPELIQCVAAASGSAKWLVLAGLDRYIFGEWLQDASHPIALFGSSIGAWRMAVAAKEDPKAGFNAFIEDYVNYKYIPGMTAAEITEESYRVLGKFLNQKDREAIVNNSARPLHIIAARGKGLCGVQNKAAVSLGFFSAFLANMVSRKSLRYSFERFIFYSGNECRATKHFEDDGFPTQAVALTSDNLHDAVMASGAIPFVLDPIFKIDGAKNGPYYDGGILDYHFDVAWQLKEGIVLFPHFYGDITPGWFDKVIKRKAKPSRLDNVLLLSPSEQFVAALPGGKIPQRQNFKDMDEETRINFWRHTVAESERLADEFKELLENQNKLMDCMKTV